MAEEKITTGLVLAIKIPCLGEQSDMFIPVRIPEDDLIFTETDGDMIPISRALGLNIRLRKCSSSDSRGFGKDDLDNQIATYLMIETESGFARPIWQMNVGTVIVAREDKKPLSENHLEVLCNYITHLLDKYGDGNPRAVESSITRENFVKFWKYNYNRPRSADFMMEWNTSE